MNLRFSTLKFSHRSIPCPGRILQQGGGRFVQTLCRPPAAVTAQVDDGDNLLIQQSLQELAAAIGLTTAQVTTEVTGEVAGEITGQVTAPVAVPVRRMFELLSDCGELGNAEILKAFDLKSRRRMQETYLAPVLRVSLVEYTVPDKPTSSLQKYHLTEKGLAWLAGRQP